MGVSVSPRAISTLERLVRIGEDLSKSDMRVGLLFSAQKRAQHAMDSLY